jgi:hypothetical protein
MKTTKFLFSALLLVLLTAGFAKAQTTPGVKVKENKGKTIVYEVSVSGADSPALCQYLDQKMKEKPGVVSSVTNPQTGICTVEASPSTPVESFKSAVKNAGFEIKVGQ